MRRLHRFEWQYLISNRFLLFFFAVCLLGTWGYVVRGLWMTYDNALYFLLFVFRLSPILFVLFSAMTFHLTSEANVQKIEETLYAMPDAYRRHTLSLGWLMSLLGLLVFAIFAGTFAIRIASMPYASFLFSEVHGIFYFLFLTAFYLLGATILGVWLGVLLSFLKNRLAGYLLLLLIFLMSFVLGNLPAYFFYSLLNLNLFPLFDLFHIGGEGGLLFSSGSFLMYPYGFPIQWYQLARYLFWLCIIGTWLWLLFYGIEARKRTGVVSGMLMLLAIGSLILYAWPSSMTSSVDNYYFGLAEDPNYYQTHSSKVQTVPWRISSLELNGSILRKLVMQATVHFEEPLKEPLLFTLYHGYRVNSVQAIGGETLHFEQEGDYLTVYTDVAQEGLIFHYAGSSPKYFSNEQGVSLSGGFPWIPQPGHQPVYIPEKQAFAQSLPREPIPVTLHLKSVQPIETNLPKVENEVWQGVTNGVTLVAGMYEEETIEGITFVYPYLSPETVIEVKEGIAQKMVDEGAFPSGVRKVLFLTNMNYTSETEKLALFTDHVTLTSLWDYDQNAELLKIPIHKQQLYAMVQAYLQERETFDARVAIIRQDIDSEETPEEVRELAKLDWYYRLANVLEKNEELVLNEYTQYFEDDQDLRDTETFIRDMEARIQ